MSPARRSLSLALAAWVALAPGWLAACSTTPDKRILQYLNQSGFGKRYQGDAQERDYASIGDSVTFVDAFHPELSGSERVGDDGTIQIPEVGSLVVAGMTRAELETYLNEHLQEFFVSTDVKVTIDSGNAKVYYVVGEVGSEGSRPWTGDLTVFDAVMDAEPEEHTANLGRVKVIRLDPRDPLIFTVDVADMWESGDSTYNVQVKEYDIVYVPPTLLKQVADLVSAAVVPFTSVLRSVLNVIFQFQFGGGGFNRRRRGFF